MQIYSKNIDVTEPLKVYLEEKIAHVHKIAEEIISLRVDLSRDTHHNKGDVFRVEVNLNIPNHFLRVVEKRPDVREAIDEVANKLVRQLRDVKEKRISKRKLRSWLRLGKG